MKRKPFGFKPTLRQQRIRNDAAMRWLCGPDTPDEVLNNVAPRKERAKPVQREAPVVAAISDLLAVHPRVLLAVRQNSGMASYEAKSGRYAPVYFYRLLTHGDEITITDFWGLLNDGRPFAIEAKAPGFTKPRTDRENMQANFLALMRNCGGIGLFATSVDEVAAALS